MMLTSMPGAMLENGDLNDEQYAYYVEFVFEATKAGLLVVHDPETFVINGSPYLSLRLLVVRRDQSWRIPAFLSLMRAFQGQSWTDGAEQLRSSLLGYTDEQIKEWIDFKNHHHSGWGFATIYGVATMQQVNQLRRLGMRSMTDEVRQNVSWFQVKDQRQLRQDAHMICGSDVVVCRVGMSHDKVIMMTSTQRHSDIAFLKNEQTDITEWNEALRSRIEIWTPEGWR